MTLLKDDSLETLINFGIFVRQQCILIMYYKKALKTVQVALQIVLLNSKA
jgi:hypothetical protein